MTTKGNGIIAAATSGQRPSRRGSAAGSPATERTITVWAHLDSEPVAHGDRLVLAPGASHVLEVTLAQATGDEQAFTVRGDLVLQARWSGDSDVRVDESPIDVSLTSVPGSSVVEEFRLEVATDARRTTGQLAVTARDRVTGRLHSIFSCTAEIDAKLRAPPPAFAATAIRLDRKPDPRLAVLYVHGSGDQILVDGFHASSVRLESTRIKRPPMDFVRFELQKADHPADQIINDVLDYSRQGIRDLHAWFNEVLRDVDDRAHAGSAGQLALIIVEQVDARVPWEMLTLEDGTVLGARAIVTRWIVISEYSRSAVQLNPGAVSDRRGKVLSYVDVVEAKLKVLAAALKARSQEPYELRALLQRLATPSDGVALVMLTCHGIFVSDTDEGQYGSRQGNYSRITRRDLVRIASSVERPLVFVNACHSARLSDSKHDTVGLPVGLPEAFLRGYARGYLGTIGAVTLDFAAELGTCILDAALAAAGVCIPELLLERRRKAAANLANDPETFVDTFMYVFYGSPHDRLMLDAGVAPGAAHD